MNICNNIISFEIKIQRTINAMKTLNIVKKRFWIKDRNSPSNINENIGQIWETTDSQTINHHQKIVLNVFTGGPYLDYLKIKRNTLIINWIEFLETLKKIKSKLYIVDIMKNLLSKQVIVSLALFAITPGTYPPLFFI